jgi:5-methylcytosine-specific restriction protein A
MFEVGKIYNRRDEIHKVYGGQQQRGISTPANHPLIFLFTGESGESYGYEDKFQPDGTFRYTGEGQVGDMEMLRGNSAIRDHQELGKNLFLFEYVKSGYVRFMGEVVCVGHHIEQRVDRSGDRRDAIIFHLALLPSLASSSIKEPRAEYNVGSRGLKSRSLADCRRENSQPGFPANGM